MPPSLAQRTLINQFVQITGVPEKNAQRVSELMACLVSHSEEWECLHAYRPLPQQLLRATGWKLDTAVDSFYQSSDSIPGLGIGRDPSRDALARLFDKFRSQNDEVDTAGIDGTVAYLRELGVNMENAEFLLVMEIVQAPGLGEMTKSGFIEGWNFLGADTIAKQKQHVSAQIRSLSSDTALFKRVYRHTFFTQKEKGQKALPLENAIPTWQLLFSPPGQRWVTASTNWSYLWSEFLEAKWTRSVNKDMWNQTFEFYLKTIEDETLSFWSEDSAWPGVIDEFVAYAKQKRGDSPEKMETD